MRKGLIITGVIILSVQSPQRADAGAFADDAGVGGGCGAAGLAADAVVFDLEEEAAVGQLHHVDVVATAPLARLEADGERAIVSARAGISRSRSHVSLSVRPSRRASRSPS